MAFPCQRPFGHQNGVVEVPKWRILPDRFGAEANSPVMDNLGGGPLGITELLLRPTTVPTYLKDDWFRDWGALQQLTPYYPNRPAGTTRSRFGNAQRTLEPGAAAPLGMSPNIDPRAIATKLERSGSHRIARLDRRRRRHRGRAAVRAGAAAAGQADHRHHRLAAGPRPRTA